MGKLTLNDGTEFNGDAIFSDDLFLYVHGESMQTVFDSLIDPNNTSEIVYTQVNGEDISFTGYTKLIAVRDEGNDLVTAVLRKGA